jgi:hypothetical protein
MKRAARVNWILLFAVVAALFFVSLFFFASEPPTGVANRFMVALAKGDVDTLTRMTYAPGRDEKGIRDQWDWAVNKAGPHYRFRWQVLGATQADQDTANVRLFVERNLAHGGSYEERFEIPLVRHENEWKVDVRSISREMFPGLPR